MVNGSIPGPDAHYKEPCGARMMVFTNQPLLGHGLERVLQRLASELTIVSGPVHSLAEAVLAWRPDILLVDLTHDIGVLVLAQVQRASPSTRILVMAPSLSWEMAHQLRTIGVRGVLRRNCGIEECIAAFRSTLSGTIRLENPKEDSEDGGEIVHLSPREGQLVTLLSQGLKNKEMADCLGISEGTVRVYLSKLYLKIGVNDRFELALFGLRNSANLPAIWPQQMQNGTDGSARVPSMRTMWLRRSRARLLATAVGARGGGL